MELMGDAVFVHRSVHHPSLLCMSLMKRGIRGPWMGKSSLVSSSSSSLLKVMDGSTGWGAMSASMMGGYERGCGQFMVGGRSIWCFVSVGFPKE